MQSRNVFTTDVYNNIINKNASDRSLVLVGRLATITLGVIVDGAHVLHARQIRARTTL